MDLSALIFVALAAAWAAYLVPKALKHHEDDRATRTVESFSERMRVLARRDAVAANRTELVVEGAKDATDAKPMVEDKPEADGKPDEADDADEPVEEEVETEAVSPKATPVRRRTAAAVAARRRRRVLGVILLGLVAVTGLAIAGVVAWPYLAIPGGLLVAWLVACRLMVRRERMARPVRVRKPRRTLADEEVAADRDPTGEVEAVADKPAAADEKPDGWDPVPMVLPTYVAKESAPRTVRTIDLDGTGVWSSGRNEADSRLARESSGRDAAPGERRRASGA